MRTERLQPILRARTRSDGVWDVVVRQVLLICRDRHSLLLRERHLHIARSRTVAMTHRSAWWLRWEVLPRLEAQVEDNPFLLQHCRISIDRLHLDISTHAVKRLRGKLPLLVILSSWVQEVRDRGMGVLE